jgi:hypothetical protein
MEAHQIQFRYPGSYDESRSAAEMSDTAIFEAQSTSLAELSGEIKQDENSTSAELAAPYEKPHMQE